MPMSFLSLVKNILLFFTATSNFRFCTSCSGTSNSNLAQEAEADGQKTPEGLNGCNCGTKAVVSLVVEDGVDRPLLHVGLLAVPPGLVGQQVQADVRVCAVFTAREQVPASG